MTHQGGLHRFLTNSAQRRAEHIAVVDPTRDVEISYRDLERLSDRLRDRLVQIGVSPGDRVGIYLPKSIDSVAAIFGILKAGAAYVPVDPTAPAARNAFIFGNCAVSAVIVTEASVEELRSEMVQAGAVPAMLVLAGSAEVLPLQDRLDREDEAHGAAPAAVSVEANPDDLAYILYTSGSTGKPKGVMLSHENATSFVDWCSEALEPNEDDRFSSHAPFHFDLSILDIHLPIKHGATLLLVGEELGKNPAGMVAMIAERGLTVWYSTPSVLTLLMEHGKLAARDDFALRTILFAGEVFPVKHLRRLKEILPGPRYFNLYGPTETNVCTWYEVAGPVEADRVRPYPIGAVCSHLQARVVGPDGRNVPAGEEGELIIAGPGVMQGYWKLPERTAEAFIEDGSGRWYRTGDVVIEGDGGVYTFVGRRDRMVKRRGYRIELGEIESALYRHADITEAAAIADAGEEGVTIKAFYSTRAGDPLSMIQLKKFCADNLPNYMIPDRFSFQAVLPKTSTDKIDYQRLKEVE